MTKCVKKQIQKLEFFVRKFTCDIIHGFCALFIGCDNFEFMMLEVFGLERRKFGLSENV